MAKCTVWNVLTAAAKYDGSATAHKDVVANLQKHGHHAKMSDAWCTETIMSILYDAGGIDLVGGYSQVSDNVKKKAEKLGIYHKGSDGILPGDIIIYGTNGDPNHTELAVGHNVTISGNYNKGCGRRSWKGRHVMGYVRPKYAPMGEMDNLQATIAACDVMLDVYGSGETRERQLSVFGKANAKKIQDEVTRVWGSDDKISFDMAVYIISGRAGKDPYRKKRLGTFARRAQDRVEEIYALHTRSKEQAARDVIADKYGKLAVRELLLTFNGYKPADVQAIVDKLMKAATKPSETTAADPVKIRLYVPRFWENDQDKYFGDESIFLQYAKDGKTIDHAIVFDTGMAGSLGVKKLTALTKKVDAIVVTHDHGDHMGLVKAMIDACEVGRVYLPVQDGIRKYQKKYAQRMDSLEKYCQTRKVPVPVTYLKPGDSFTVGSITCKAIFQANADKLPEKDGHHFINNMSMVYKVIVGGIWTVLIGGDLSADGIRQMMAAGVDFLCDIFKFFWHSDRGAILEAFVKKLKGVLIGYTQYHHNEKRSNGRKATHDLLRNVGAVVVRSCEDGEIFMDMEGRTLTLTTSKGIKKVFKK